MSADAQHIAERIARYRDTEAEINVPVVRVRDLVVRYDEQVVLNGISLDVHRGEVVAILGGSGSGKSTLLKCMLGVVEPVSGSVEIFGVDMNNASLAEREEVYKHLGMVYQSGALFSSLTVWENVALPLQEHTDLDANKVDAAVRMRLGMVRLSGFADRMPDQLSGGQKKRVAFARAISMTPPLLFCDEPSSGLDPRIARGIDDLIVSLNKTLNMGVVVVTHDMESVAVIAHRIVMLGAQAGGARVIYEGPYDAMHAAEDEAVRDFLARKALTEPRAEAKEVLKQLVPED